MLPSAVKLSIIMSSTFVAALPLVNDVTDSANKVGTLGMQGLLAFMLIILGVVIWYMEKKRTADREARDLQISDQYKELLSHHNSFITKADGERVEFHNEMKMHATELRGLTERSILAMHAMATSTDALREYLKERTIDSQGREAQRSIEHQSRERYPSNG